MCLNIRSDEFGIDSLFFYLNTAACVRGALGVEKKSSLEFDVCAAVEKI